jgi:hypothetical protein
MDLADRLQIKPGTLVAILGAGPDCPDLAAAGSLETTANPGEAGEAGAFIAFALRHADLTSTAGPAVEAARQDKLAWIAYPKAGQLGTDINRDTLARAAAGLGIRPVRQIAIDEIWSALRFRPA